MPNILHWTASRAVWVCAAATACTVHVPADDRFATAGLSTDGATAEVGAEIATSPDASTATGADTSPTPDSQADGGTGRVCNKHDDCDDGNPCTVGHACSDGKCTDGKAKACPSDDPCVVGKCDLISGGQCKYKAALAETPCDDGNQCSKDDACSDGACQGQAVDCDDKNPCTLDGCAPTKGCSHKALADKPCDDGDACSLGDSCADGVCKPGKPKACEPTGPCQAATCEKATGACKVVPLAEGATCSDGNACTDGDTCAGGLCTAGAKACDDSNPCTSDGCDAAKGCTAQPTSGPCDDANSCTSDDACAAGICSGKADQLCDDGNPCTVDSCDASNGCKHGAVTAACDDGNPCTKGDACAAGSCASGANNCPCLKDADCLGSNDSNPCNGTLYCNVAAAQPACEVSATTVVACDAAAGGCAAAACDSKTGACKTTASTDGKACDADGSKCTQSDTCKAGGCVAGSAASCDDNNPCTADACDPVLGCVWVAQTGNCDADGNACTVADQCQGKLCIGGPAKGCDDNNPCTTDTCDPKTGACKADGATLAGQACDADGSACTAGDNCASGACKAGAVVPCDDGNPCTEDSCDPKLGCHNKPNAAGCDDKNPCTASDACAQGVCAGVAKSAELLCDDGNPCTADTCDPKTGCGHAGNSAPCEDGNPCTVGDGCLDKACKPGANTCGCASDADCTAKEDGDLCNGTLVCDKTKAPFACKLDPQSVVVCDSKADDACSANTCDPKTGACSMVSAPGGKACDDGSACTDSDACLAGKCSGAAVACDDKNPCTADSCAPTKGCQFAANKVGCNDNNACTVGDACVNGACLPGAVTACDDGNPCTNDACDKLAGCTGTANSAVCNDGNACTTGDMCGGGKCLGVNAVACDDGNACSLDICQPASGCASKPANDGQACGGGLQCTAGVCGGGVAPMVTAAGGAVGLHACALTSGGSVFCWGGNGSGQVGNGTTTGNPIATPASVVGLPGGAAEVASGSGHTCARLSTGEVWCWGGNASGQLGDGTTQTRPTPAIVKGLNGAVAIAAGTAVSCAVVAAGTVHCWGSNDSYQCGDDKDIVKTTPVQVAGVSDAVKVSIGDKTACALTNKGAVQCWGAGTTYALGQGTSTGPTATAKTVLNLQSGTTALDAGYNFACAVTDAGKVLCWGAGGNGQLGNNNPTDQSIGVEVAGLTGVPMAVSAGYDHACALVKTGGVQCWGVNAYGALGDGTTTKQQLASKSVALPLPAVSVAAGSGFTCATLSSGAVTCWGTGGGGQLGTGLLNIATSPVQTARLLGTAKAVSAGGQHTCALLHTGRVSCWGRNQDYALGTSTSGITSQPLTTVAMGYATLLSSGDKHNCAVLQSGSAACWGTNFLGELGNNSTTLSATPVQPIGLTANVTAIAAGGSHSCAVQKGAVWCWGSNTDGQLGTGSASATPAKAPKATTGLTANVVAVAAGAWHTLALKADGKVYAWGSNVAGQLGNGTNKQAVTPGLVAGLPEAVDQIDANNSRSCALTKSGAVYCWGTGSHPTDTNKWSQPNLVVGLPAIAKLAMGGEAVCAASAAGKVWCWGVGPYGQLGTGQLTYSSTTPVEVAIQGDAAQIAVGGAHACVLSASGKLQCWGDNSGGQLGNGFDPKTPLPVEVKGLAGAAVEVAAGMSFSCARIADGSAQCWGTNNGQLGTGNGTPLAAAGPVVKGLTGATAIVAGDAHACAIAKGEVKCWGAGGAGQLGNASLISNVPVTANLNLKAIALGAGFDTTCAVVEGGDVYCWGYNQSGQLGNGKTTATANPTPAKVPLKFPAVAVDVLTTGCAALTNSTVSCWGSGQYGALGNGGTTDSLVPVQVGGVLELKQLGVGYGFACGLKTNGAVHCWGTNGAKQLGYTTAGNQATTPATAALTGATLLTSGEGHSCAQVQAGLVCWGDNYAGELGIGTLSLNGELPKTQTALGESALSLAGGFSHTCAALQSGKVKCWGSNDKGQLGNGATWSLGPVAVGNVGM